MSENKDSQVVTEYVHEGFVPLAKIKDSHIETYHTDYLGTPKELTDEQGAIVWQGNYDEYGKVTAVKEQTEQNIRFQGQYEDEETGLFYNQFRFYDADAGRYLNQDPLRIEGDNNLYHYTLNPLNWIDPFGLKDGTGSTHVTYRGVKNGKAYTGYASAPSSLNLTPAQIVSRRYSGDFSNFGGVAPTPVFSGEGVTGKRTARGLEQRYFEKDVANLGRDKVANKQNPVGDRNANRDEYLKEADKHLGDSC